MSKCNKVKNPCKICLGAVTQKNGLQCKGACESWVHYACLNYTPGRIKDIKAGIIRVTCPCPDCKTSQPKEFRTDEPFSCTNMLCPANRAPQCGNMQCPVNSGADRMMQTSGFNIPTCPLSKCGKNDCKQHSSPMILNNPMGQMGQMGQPCSPAQQPGFNPLQMMKGSSSDACIDFNKCPSGCVTNFPGDMMQNMGMGNMQTMPSMMAMEQMCNTVGLLTKQINELMMKMQKGNSPCTQKGPRSLCPKPCYCPGNPGQ